MPCSWPVQNVCYHSGLHFLVIAFFLSLMRLCHTCPVWMSAPVLPSAYFNYFLPENDSIKRISSRVLAHRLVLTKGCVGSSLEGPELV